MENQGGGSTSSRSNRTFMELKFTATIYSSEPLKCSNRTFMELKCSMG